MNKGHTLFKTGDSNAPEGIKDRNGEVVLSMCKVCGKAESELDQPCIKIKLYTEEEVADLLYDYDRANRGINASYRFQALNWLKHRTTK